MLCDGKHTVIERTIEENKFIEKSLGLLESRLHQMMEDISYPDFPLVNSEFTNILDDMLGMIMDLRDKTLVKPVPVNNDGFYFYDLSYFKGRKDTGSIYIKTKLCRDEFLNEDCFLESLVEEGVLTSQDASSIVELVEIDEYFYSDMTGEN